MAKLLMKAVVQRVKNASVMVNASYVSGSINQGLLILLGVMKGDTAKESAILAKKIGLLRIFTDEQGKMNHAVGDVRGQVLVIPNFTLGADCSHGRRPYFSFSATPIEAKPLFHHFCTELENTLQQPIFCGVFGADMEITTTLSGPVTICLDTDEWTQG